MAPSVMLGLRHNLDELEKKRLSPHACLSLQAKRRQQEPWILEGHRQFFALDADRVMHSMSYTRYIDKTQVFSLVDNDEITHRVLHVQLVSKIARTVGRFLGLNEDLIEAMALAHDIGHPPFGHDGERFLDEKCKEYGLGSFQHNIQSVRFLEKVEKHGQGLNLSLQVLDGVLCHDGEVHSQNLSPMKNKTFQDFDQQIKDKLKNSKMPLIPMTMEGCVVRICDTISYVGRDLEDAISLGLVRRSELPKNITSILGKTNGTIVYRLVQDLIENSVGKEYVAFTPEIGQALLKLKSFNLKKIYTNPAIKKEHGKIRKAYHCLFEDCLKGLTGKTSENPFLKKFLKKMSADYLEEEKPAIVRDFISGMTDDYFLKCVKNLNDPPKLPQALSGF